MGRLKHVSTSQLGGLEAAQQPLVLAALNPQIAADPLKCLAAKRPGPVEQVLVVRSG